MEKHRRLNFLLNKRYSVHTDIETTLSNCVLQVYELLKKPLEDETDEIILFSQQCFLREASKGRYYT